jgi:NADH-quinone oxidoreductase subunit C
VIFVAPDVFPKVAKALKEDADLCFEYLSDIRGVDYLDQDKEPRFEAVYELHSFEHNHSVRIRVGLEEENPSVPTVSDL